MRRVLPVRTSSKKVWQCSRNRRLGCAVRVPAASASVCAIAPSMSPASTLSMICNARMSARFVKGEVRRSFASASSADVLPEDTHHRTNMSAHNEHGRCTMVGKM